MSASFIPASRSADHGIGTQSYSPPSLTTSSSPTSSDSTGDEELQKTTRKRSSHRSASGAGSGDADLSNKASFQQSLNNADFSPSIWSQQSHPSLISGLSNNSAIQPLDKVGFENMNFGGWDGAFANLAVPASGDMSMDMDSTAGTDYAFSPSSAQSPASASSHTAAASLSGAAHALSNDSPSGSDRKTGFTSTAPSTVASNQSFAGSGEESDENWPRKPEDNDEAMFDSFVQAGSFAPSSTKSNAGPGSMPVSMSTSANQSTSSSSGTMMPPSSLSKSTSSFSKVADGVPSSASSRRNSGESSEPRKQAGLSSSRRFGSQTAVHSNNLDADLGYSALDVAHPNREGLKDLQVHIHGVPMQGAKSRVETQIRMRIELVRPKATAGGWERIGSFTHIKLPPLSGTKRKSKKYQKSDVPPEKTLFVDATVVNATPPHDRVFVCKGCRQRERKRAHRKKDPKVPMDLQPTEEEIKSLGIDPSAPDAIERTQSRMEEEEKKRVVLFNCGDYVDFEDGEAVLPTRITCYCRHHKEKVGFCVIFTMRDWQGRLIATGSTPPIMITDDHKSMGIAAQAAQLAASTPTNAQQPQGIVKQVNGTSPRNQLDDSFGQGSASGSTTPSGAANGDGASKQQRKERSKPYDDNRRRRNTTSKELNMTPFGTGQNTPSVSATSPPPPAVGNGNSVDFSSADFWSAFAVGGNTMDGLGRSNSTSTGNKTPGDTSSMTGSPASTAGISAAAPQLQSQPMQTMPPALQAQLAQGSLSPASLQTNLQSLPNFDLEEFFRNAQAGVTNGVDFAQLMAMAAAAALPAHLRQPSSTVATPPLIMGNFSQHGSPVPSVGEQANMPKISKLIPGEGPTSGGIEVTILGENFTEGISCVFGDVPATNTKVWASNTLVCILPPSSSPGPVVVSLKSLYNVVQPTSANGPLQLFTYVDTTDRALMELALQVVGLQMTGQMRSAREVAMRVVGTGAGQGLPTSLPGNGTSQGAREAVAGLFTARGQSSNFQDSVVQFLSLLDTDIASAEGSGRRDAIRLANKQGHTLLHLATMMGFHRLVDFLVRCGCPLDARDRNGATALHFAAIQGRVAIARLLLRSGARDDVGDANGLYAIDLARDHDQVDLEMILDNTSRTGHWQTRRLSSHVTSGVVFEEDGLLTDDVSSEASLSDVDDDNVSTSCDDYSEDSLTQDDESEEEEARDDDQEARQAVSDLPSLVDEKSHLRALGTLALDESNKLSAKRQEAALDHTAAVNKSWLTKAGDTGVDWMNRKLLSQAVTERFAHLHMPAMPQMPQMSAISVFHLALPAAPSMPSMPWYGSPRAESDKMGDGSDKDNMKTNDQMVAQQGWEQFERGRLQTLWRTIVEEGAWALNPLYSPPPAYESVAVSGDADEDSKKHIAADSLANMPLGSSSQSTSECTTPVAGPSRRSSTKRRPTTTEQGPSTARPFSSLSTPSGVKTRSTPASGNQAATSRRRPTPRTLRDDAMLLWFWIPVLLVVAILLLFSKSSSILSYADLMSYLDLNLPAVGKIREIRE